MYRSALRRAQHLLLEDAEDFFFAHDEELFTIELDLGAGVLTEEDGVASLDVEREDLAFIVGLALANRDNLALLGLFLGRIGDDDAAADALALFQTTNQDAVMQRRKRSSCHILESPYCCFERVGPPCDGLLALSTAEC